MVRLYGKKDRCVWCGKKNKKQYNQITMRIKQAKPSEEQALVCSDECANAVAKTCKYVEKGIWFYFAGLILGIILCMFGAFLSNFFIGLGTIIFGITITIFPFVTPQTVKLFGLKNAMLTGRLLGIIMFILGSSMFFA